MGARSPANPADSLRHAEDRFVSVWGQMAGAWGISRTMAEVHALLYITGGNLCTDDVMERLQISRGNASMSIRALVDWGIVSRVNKRGDRKEYFAAEQDVWALFRAIVRERMNREVDPLLASLHEIHDLTGIESSKEAGKTSAELHDQIVAHRERLEAMLEFFSILEKLGARFISPSGKGLQLAASMLSKMPDFASMLPSSKHESRARGPRDQTRNDEASPPDEMPLAPSTASDAPAHASPTPASTTAPSTPAPKSTTPTSTRERSIR